MDALRRCLAVGLTFAILVALQSAAQAQFVRDPAAVEAYEAGEELLRQEKWEEAIVRYTDATNIDRTYAEAWLGRGDALRELEDFQSAFSAYRSAVDIDPKLARAYYGRAVCSRETGQINLANTDFDTAMELDRNDPEIAAGYGDLLINFIGDPNKAIQKLDKAIDLDETNAEAFRNRGWAHTLLRQFEDGVADLEKAIELDDTDFESYTKLSSVYLLQDDYQPGIDALSRAIETYEPEESTDPDTFVNGYLQRADAELKLGNLDNTTAEARQRLYQAVIADTNAVLAEYPDRYPEAGWALYRRGKAQRMQEKFGESIKSLTDAIQVAAGEEAAYLAEAYLKRGICWHYQQQDSLARGDFEQAATLNFEDPLPYLWIGITYAQEGEFRQAIDNFGEAIAKNPSFSLAHVNRGVAYMQLGEYNRAVDNFNEAIRSESNESEHFIMRGIAHMALEEFQKAFDSFEHAILRDEESVQAHRRAAEALRQLGRPSLAEQNEIRANALEAAGN